MDMVERYIQDVRDIRLSGTAVPETSYYPAIANLLNEIGKSLRPRVTCIINPKNAGAGIPDGGLFTRDQLQSSPDLPMITGILPARGAIEVKGLDASVDVVAQSEQVERYCRRYGQVLVTNLRDFALVALMPGGVPAIMERFHLAADERDFLRRPAEAITADHGARFREYLTRVILHGAPLTRPRDLAWLLASYARETLLRVEHAEMPAVDQLREALEDTLGMQFQGERGEHFFRSTMVQTLFYGIFSAWVLWCKENPVGTTERFRWREAEWSLHVPVISALFEQLMMPGKLKPLGLEQILEWAGQALNRVDRSVFFANFEEAHAVQYFYEPFLEAFDPELRKQLGVWYTPPEVVRYMVARVDAALRDDLGIADGLADPNVYILDPAAGTGSYLVEVLRHIAMRLREKGEEALLGYQLKQAAMSRVVGFEILPAPFVISHLQLGLLLQSEGAPLHDDTERAAVYLTNALTGWSIPERTQLRLLFPEFQQERDAAERVKRDAPILVVLGNPPYNGFAGVAVDEERDLSLTYRETKQAPAPQGQGLNDVYVRFFRMAERRIVEQTGRGIICYISNYSWLDGLSFTGMRERYLEVFDEITIDCLNGDKYKTGKLTPEDEPDPSVFSTEFNPEGIQVGTAIALLVRKEQHRPAEVVQFRQLWGRDKRRQLDAEAVDQSAVDYQRLTPPLELGFPFIPTTLGAGYLTWPPLPRLLPNSFPGVKTSRDDVVVDIDRGRLVERMEAYFDPALSDSDIAHLAPSAMQEGMRFAARATRKYLLQRGFLPDKIVRYLYRPFDLRWLYWEPEMKLLDEKRSEYFRAAELDTVWLSSGQRNRKDAFYQPQVTRYLADHHIVESNVALFPRARPIPAGTLTGLQPAADTSRDLNLSEIAESYVGRLDVAPDSLFYHVVSVLHAPLYRAENASALRQDWPRVPLVDDRDILHKSAELGRQVASLLDPQTRVSGVSLGELRQELRQIGSIAREGGGALNPDAGDLEVAAGWGHAGKNGVTMPGAGRIVRREFSPKERAAIEAGVSALGLTPDQAYAQLGPTTCDVYLNDVAYWRNIPDRVWTFTIGGYQVIKKWLSYREAPLLGRALRADEALYVGEVARRIATILLLQPALDANYEAVKQNAYTWSGEAAVAAVI